MPYLVFDAREKGVGYALAAGGVAHIHALDLGVFREEGDAAAAHRSTLPSCEEELDVRLKDRVEAKAMPLLRRIFRREHGLELTDQQAHLIGRSRRNFDPHVIAAANWCSSSTRYDSP
jgi:hypothetical protein